MKRFLLFLSFFVSLISFAQTGHPSTDKQNLIAFHPVNDTTGVPPANGIRIRCGATIYNDNTPVFIIDGVVADTTELKAVNPGNIKSIDILKDASAIALYGSLAQHGVILITTKSKSLNRLEVVDGETGEAVANASVKLIAGDQEFLLVADSAGTVFLDKEKMGVKRIEVSSVGYDATTVKIDLSKQKHVVIKMHRRQNKLADLVIYSSAIRCHRGCGTWCRVYRTYADSTSSLAANKAAFLSYPNPVTKGQTVTVIPKESISGTYTITATAGQLVQTGKISANEEQPFKISTANWAAGIYLIVLRDETLNKQFVQKFIVQ